MINTHRHCFIRFGKKSLDSIPIPHRVPPTPNKRFLSGHKSKMKHALTLLLALSASITIICLSGCDTDYDQDAVERMTDQDLLAKIAMEDEKAGVRQAAVAKLTDQDLLAKIAMEAKDRIVLRKAAGEVLMDPKTELEVHVCLAAVAKLTDQDLLAKIALEAKDWSVLRLAAVEKLTDQALLAKIALEDEKRVREAAVKVLIDQAALGKIAVDNENWRVRLILKVIQAFDSVPTEHRERLIAEVLPALRVLSDPAVVSVIGDIVSVKTDWKSSSALYIVGGTKRGERFTCSVKVRNLPESLSHIWSTSFPQETRDLGFESADVNAGDLLKPAFDRLSPAALAKYAVEDEDWGVRQAAVEKLMDQAVLAKVAVEDEDMHVRQAAVENLMDQAVLAKVAVKDKDESVRIAAVEKLTDQGVLAKIVVEDEDMHVRQAAVRKLTDQGVLAKIAVEDEDWYVRQAAVENLMDQAVLAKVAVKDKDESVRIAAVEKLTDQVLLAKIAVEDKGGVVREAAQRRLEALRKGGK